MVNFATFTVGTAVLAAQLAFAAPGSKRDSAIGQEVAVSAPDGIPLTDSAELSSQLAAEASTKADNGGVLTDTAANAYTTEAYMGAASDMTTAAYETSTAAWESAAETTAAVYDTSAAVYETTAAYDTTAAWETTAAVYETTSEAAYTPAATYGSGSNNWGDSGYNDCVQQCIASFGAPAATYAPPPPSGTESADSGMGGGATHTVIVAPTQGVLRYVPFAVNASVGDTVKFMWNANMHTVTKGSQLELCNKTSDSAFTSGVQNKSFTFTQVVNTTDPTFFFCNVPTHCQKGMFGIINPPNADVASSNSSVAAMMPVIAENNSDVSAWASYTQQMTSGSKAATWGNSIDMGNMPEWSQPMLAENVMYTRNFLAANPDVYKDDGTIDLGASSAPLMIPQDLNAVLAASGSASAGTPESTSAATGSAAAGSASSSPAASGARGLTASFSLASIVAFGAALFVL